VQTLNAQTGEGTSKQKIKQVKRSVKNKQRVYLSGVQFYAQSGEGNPTYTEQLTRFYDESVVHQPDAEERQGMQGIPRQKIQGMPPTLENFLTRPRVATQFSWVDTYAIRTEVLNLDFPKTVMTPSSFTAKLEQFSWWRPDFEFEIQLNSTKFHYGRLMFVVRPFADWLHASYITAQNASTWPEWYQISANSQQSLKIRVPFRHWVRKLPSVMGQDQFLRMFNLRAYVTAPLSSAMSATVAPVTVTVYWRLVDPGISSYNGQALAQSGEQNNEVLKMLGQGVSTLLPNPIGQATTTISSAFNTISSVSKDISRLAVTAGLSNPTNPAPTTAMQIRQPLFSKSNDMPNSVNLGPTQANCLMTDYGLANATEDEMDIVNIVGHPSLLYTGKIESTDAIGKVLCQYYLNPQMMVYGDYSFVPATNTLQPTPIYYIGRMFTNWRGAYKFHISFISSSFHSVRVRFLWNPVNLDAAITTYNLNQRVSMYNVLMDINQQTDFSILVPYDQCVEWLKTGITVGSTQVSANCANGYMSLVLETVLTSASDTIQPIYYQVFVSMADDAQFAVPNLERLNIWGNPFLADPALALSLVEDDDLVAQDGYCAQSGERVGECEVPSSSSFCLRNTEYISIMGDPVHAHRVYGESTVFEYSSVKQLANMLSPMERFTTVDTTNFVGRQVNPFGVMKFAYNDDMWLCYYNQIRSIFRFGRGSFRFVALVDASSMQATSYLRPGIDDLTAYWATTNNDPFMGTASLSVVPGGFQYFMSTMYMPADVVIPYYSTVPCLPFISHATKAPPFFATSSAGNITFSNQSTAGLAILYFGATSDDFIFGTRIGMPTLKFPAPTP
jgi:hypothetical protein